MNLCLTAEQKPGMRLSMQWWEQPALGITGIRAGKAAVKGGEKTGVEKSKAEGKREGE